LEKNPVWRKNRYGCNYYCPFVEVYTEMAALLTALVDRRPHRAVCLFCCITLLRLKLGNRMACISLILLLIPQKSGIVLLFID
jgi:hypothetical protein